MGMLIQQQSNHMIIAFRISWQCAVKQKKSIEWMRPQLEHLEAMGKEGVKWWL